MATSLPPLPGSTVGIPVKIYARPFLDKAEALAPLEFVSDQWPGYTQYGCDFRYKYRFVRSALKFSAAGNRVSVSLTGNYQVAGSKSACILGKQVSPWINGSCGFGSEPLRKAAINLITAVRFLPDYTLNSRSWVESVRPVDKCSVTFLNTDVTGMVMGAVRTAMDAFAASLDHDIAALDISPFLRIAGTAVSKKVVLRDYGYLALNLSAVRIGPLSLTGDTARFTAGFSCFPELSSDTGSTTGTTLPPLVAAAMPEGFTFYANANYDYPFISRLLAKAVKNKIFSVRGERITIENIEVSGTGENKIELKAAFSGSRKGILYLTGTPALDTGRQVISVPDLAFSLRSKSIALGAGKALFSKKILRTLRRQAVIDINDLYKQNKQQLDRALTHRFTKNIISSGSTDQIRLRALVVEKDRVLLQVFVKGRVCLNRDSQN